MKTNVNVSDKIKQFLTSPAYAVVGASNRREKYGNKVLRAYLQSHKIVYPVNKQEKTIEGLHCFSSIMQLPDTVQSISIITPPSITEQVVEEAIDHGIKNIWMQPGAESDLAIRHCKLHKINVIAGGPCILVVLNYQEKS